MWPLDLLYVPERFAVIEKETGRQSDTFGTLEAPDVRHLAIRIELSEPVKFLEISARVALQMMKHVDVLRP